MIPTDTAATWPCRGEAASRPALMAPWQASVKRNVAAGDRGGAGAAIRLQHVAIQDHGALTQRAHVDDRAQAAADKPLDFLGAAALLAPGRLAIAARVGGARQHAVFRC